MASSKSTFRSVLSHSTRKAPLAPFTNYPCVRFARLRCSGRSRTAANATTRTTTCRCGCPATKIVQLDSSEAATGGRQATPQLHRFNRNAGILGILESRSLALHLLGRLRSKALCARASIQPGRTSSAHTSKRCKVLGPNVLISATSQASRPLAISTRPTRGVLLRASNVYQRSPK
jgi:hypothetical protein